MWKRFGIVFLIFLGVHLLGVRGDISPEEVPKELKFLLQAGLDKWEPPEILSRKLPFMISGYDEEDRAIWVVDIGIWPVVDLIAKGPEFEKNMYKYVHKILRLAFDDVNRRSTPENPINQINLIVDMDQFVFTKLFGSIKASRFVVDVLSLIGNTVPFTNVIAIVNANFLAERAVLYLKPVLGSTFEKIEIFGTNSKAWIPKLLKKLPKDQLPPRYGGDKNFKPAIIFSNATEPRIY